MPRKNPTPKFTFWIFVIWKAGPDYLDFDNICPPELMKGGCLTAGGESPESLKNYLSNDKSMVYAKDISKFFLESDNVDFAFWSVEKGSGKKKPTHSFMDSCKGYHLQGWLKLKSQRDVYWLKKHLHPTAHFEGMKSTVAKNFDYCSKDETHIIGPFEYGKRPKGQGARNDLNSLYEDLGKKTPDQLVKDHFCTIAKYSRGIQFCCDILGIPITGEYRSKEPECVLIYGDSDVGKSFFVTGHFHKNFVMSSESSNGSLWFERYFPNSVCLIDEMEGSTMPLNKFKRLINHVPYSVYSRNNSSYQFNSPLIFLTSNHHYTEWWPNAYAAKDVNLYAIEKRIKHVWKWTWTSRENGKGIGPIIRVVEKGSTPEEILDKYKQFVNIYPEADPDYIFKCDATRSFHGLIDFKSRFKLGITSSINDDPLEFLDNMEVSEDSQTIERTTSNGTIILDDEN